MSTSLGVGDAVFSGEDSKCLHAQEWVNLVTQTDAIKMLVLKFGTLIQSPKSDLPSAAVGDG